MKTNTSARCIDCKDGMGKPVKVVEKDGKDFTLYKCADCNSEWLRPHNPS